MLKSYITVKGLKQHFAQSESRWEFLEPLQAADKGKDEKLDLRNPLMKAD